MADLCHTGKSNFMIRIVIYIHFCSPFESSNKRSMNLNVAMSPVAAFAKFKNAWGILSPKKNLVLFPRLWAKAWIRDHCMYSGVSVFWKASASFSIAYCRISASPFCLISRILRSILVTLRVASCSASCISRFIRETRAARLAFVSSCAVLDCSRIKDTAASFSALICAISDSFCARIFSWMRIVSSFLATTSCSCWATSRRALFISTSSYLLRTLSGIRGFVTRMVITLIPVSYASQSRCRACASASSSVSNLSMYTSRNVCLEQNWLIS
mmetsp:Transcript_103963/g.179135  ORF Transcript_103963/g.179135 Transcript_103963/m.179135 type:complete len:271 (-) Transcript_103963:385-1197(-)